MLLQKMHTAKTAAELCKLTTSQTCYQPTQAHVSGAWDPLLGRQNDPNLSQVPAGADDDVRLRQMHEL